MKQTRYSLYTILGFIVITAVVAIMAVNSLLHFQSTKSRIIEATKQHSNKTLNSLNKNISNFIESYSINEYEKLVLSEMDYVDFFAIIVHDYSMGIILGKEAFVTGKIRSNDGNVIDYDQNNKEMNKCLNECFHTYSSNMTSASGVELGKISICSSDYTVNLKMLEIIKENLINTILAIIVLSLVLFYTIQRFVLKPISETVNALSRTDKNGIPEGNISNQGAREIKSLSTSLNYMIDTIKQSRKKLEEYQDELEHLVAERVKELNCLYNISKLTGEENITVEAFLQATVDIIPPSCQYPEITCSRIQLNGKTYMTDNFKKTEWLLYKDIKVSGKREGKIEIYYLEEKPEIDEGPFVKEERNLINSVAEQLGRTIDRLQIEKRIKDDMLLSDKYIRSLPGLFYAFDDQQFIKWNSEWETVTGFSSEELATKYGTDFFEGENQKLIKEAMLTVFQVGSAEVEAELMTKSGKTIPYYFTGVREEIDGINHLIGFGIDITARKQAEKEKEKLENKLRQAQKMEAIGTLAGGIAHDFNNILGAIIGYSEMAKEDSPPESTVAKDLDKVLEGSNRAKDLVQQILAFSRQEEMEKIPLHPERVMTEVIKMLRPSLPTTIEIHQDITSTTGLILADPTQIHQLLMNLCTNAFHAMEETGGKLGISLKEVTLSTEDLVHELNVESGTFIQLSISDSGPGIPPEIKKDIFNPYFTTKETGKGTGMGLAIVHGIVKSYGGFISLYSEPGEGTVFHVFLPVVEKKMLPEMEDLEPTPVGKERILFIDDEEILAEMG
ncbi:MAG: PAS domain S-box protein, partial [Bacteroidetes bacterium]|nr:PAS domain S-box protein [Bacteroidota bacterium]